MNKRQKKKHYVFLGFENGHKLYRHYFITHNPKCKRYSVHYLREIYKSHDYACNFFDYDEDMRYDEQTKTTLDD